MGTKNRVVVEPYQVEVLVQSPGGKPIADAEVRLKRNSSADDDYVDTTDHTGVAHLLVAESDFKEDPKVPGGKAEFKIEAKKAHHGPVVHGDSEPFKNGPTSVDVSVEPLSPERIKIKNQAGWAVDFSPGTPNVDKNGRLHMILVEGGSLGKDHYGAVLTRRLDFTKTPVSEVQEELLFRIAHGDLALTAATEFEFEHAAGTDECQPGQCKIKAPAPEAKVAVVQNTLAGVKFLQLLSGPNDRVKWGPALMTDLNQRHVVGMTRLCKFMKKEHNIAIMYTQGFLRWDKATKQLDHGSHGRGRAFDFAGVAMEPPEPVSSSGVGPKARANKDFLVPSHWGTVDKHVRTAAGTLERRKPEKGETYAHTTNDAATSALPEKLFYRLDALPSAAERPKTVEPEAEADAHFAKAKTIFLSVYEFVTKQYSNRDRYLGPPALLRIVARPNASTEALADDNAPTTAPGDIAGYVIHPDYPLPDGSKPNGRQAHWNHIHFQVGSNTESEYSPEEY